MKVRVHIFGRFSLRATAATKGKTEHVSVLSEQLMIYMSDEVVVLVLWRAGSSFLAYGRDLFAQ